MASTVRRHGAGHRAVRPASSRRWREILSSAIVILAGVVVVIGFGFVASRAVRSGISASNVPVPQAPPLGEVTRPSSSPSQGPIPLGSPSPSTAPSRSPTPPPPISTTKLEAPSADPGAVSIARGSVPGTVDLSAEGRIDWVHWGEQGTFSLERDKRGGVTILEGAPTAPRFKHALSPEQFRWTDGDPVDYTDGTTTGIRTCGAGNGFTISVPAGTSTRVLKLYLGVIAGRGRLVAKLSAGSASASTTLEQKDGTFRTAVYTIRYRAPKTAQLNLRWNTEAAFGTRCGGVALQAATLN